MPRHLSSLDLQRNESELEKERCHSQKKELNEDIIIENWTGHVSFLLKINFITLHSSFEGCKCVKCNNLHLKSDVIEGIGTIRGLSHIYKKNIRFGI